MKKLSLVALPLILLSSCGQRGGAESSSQDILTISGAVETYYGEWHEYQGSSSLRGFYLWRLADFPTILLDNFDCSHVVPGDTIEVQYTVSASDDWLITNRIREYLSVKAARLLRGLWMRDMKRYHF